MSFEGLTTPTAQDGEYGPVVMFDDGKHIPCESMIEVVPAGHLAQRGPNRAIRHEEESR